jgi:hypothetical protein
MKDRLKIEVDAGELAEIKTQLASVEKTLNK